ncbi:MAG: hypothetical protein HAW60_02770 [Bdellovibrionales bacterium]|nr:hypothetical protein [Bdellovibrionales bacterium]
MKKTRIKKITTELFSLINNKEAKKEIQKISKNFEKIKKNLEKDFQTKSKKIKKLFKETHNLNIGPIQATFIPSKVYKKITKEAEQAYNKGNAEINKILKLSKKETQNKINKAMAIQDLVDSKVTSLMNKLTKTTKKKTSKKSSKKKTTKKKTSTKKTTKKKTTRKKTSKKSSKKKTTRKKTSKKRK